MQRPALVAEVALQLAEDGRCGVARELRAAAGFEAVDRLDQAEARDLQQVVERLVGVRVAQREIASQRQETLHQLLTRGEVAELVIANQELSLDLPRGSAVGACRVGRSGQPRRCEGDCTHHGPPSVSS